MIIHIECSTVEDAIEKLQELKKRHDDYDIDLHGECGDIQYTEWGSIEFND